MFKLPNKFYATGGGSGGGGSSGTTTSNKKYEITITQPPEHEPRPDFIRGIPYAAKDNVMFCRYRVMTLEDVKQIDPNATTVPENTRILLDINGNDLIIKSDMIKELSMTNAYIVSDMGMQNLIFYMAINKVEIENKTLAMLAYKIDNFIYVVKISDVDSWINFGA